MAAIRKLIGSRFDRLIVVSDTNNRTSDGCVLWKCKCDCGNEVIVKSQSLLSGNTKSCGCLHKESIITHGATNTPE